MEYSRNRIVKRFSHGGEELLLVAVTEPIFPEDAAYASLSSFCREISERSLAFAETRLLPSLSDVYDALSPHDRRFAIPRRVYTVEIRAEDTQYEGQSDALALTITARLKRRGKTEFEHTVTRLWTRSEKNRHLTMVCLTKKPRKGRKMTKKT